ncbi:MAG TPA: acetyl-CoA carboxylase biotin carboxyl carrier protein [Spirochaetota bacterium]|nr:acetyl-CoA carboxylase biotin carboxyl carrier protein [Spirochaetota bacterium]HOS33653.1 acetyl-CoA carboxylase biotin carboxyl carrier protein [Spirochaetota bacterium]HOS56115.1 acetyl-CoA carboxylase biotin carboxyl carrier protein [Spirochaetota bacterium]HPK61090.1 acetyl-CoA carboxylase biotin carboxyl carrier protein [Spirochaetota bacterium]HQF77647.1 acetyl-CoA carboxylase biotin carboxyl carrier protein [Spirochaetota bacterium]
MKESELINIFESMKINDINEVIIKDGGKTYEIRRGFQTIQNITGNVQEKAFQVVAPIDVSAQRQATANVDLTQATAVSQKPVQNEIKTDYYEIKSPLVGTFYAAPKSDAPPYVEVGSKVTKGKTICMVEAMKNFNEIECDVDGIVREICVKNGELIEFGKVLFRIEKI